MLTHKEQVTLTSIVVASDNDPHFPEFPADAPKFPATQTRKIGIPGFTNVWLKDESTNPTGTHKDRMAWEIVVTYRYFLLAKQRGQITGSLPHMSIISSGSAAFAIQTQLRAYRLPHLKVLIDHTLDSTIKQSLERIGCELFEIDLSRKALSSREILTITQNEQGFDITSSEALDPTTRFYDWLSYEILNNSPEYCFIPFGTGHLYENILNVNKKEITAEMHDPRFFGNTDILRTCNFLGATTNNPRTKATKLYSPHLPFTHFDEEWMRIYRQAGFCGPESNVYTIRENFLDDAIALAKTQNIEAEPSGIAGLALLLQLQKDLPTSAKILIVNTGKTKYNVHDKQTIR